MNGEPTATGWAGNEPRLGPPTVDDLERMGMWLGSEAGVSFVCRCNWRSGIKRTPADVRTLLDEHWWESHSGRRTSIADGDAQ